MLSEHTTTEDLGSGARQGQAHKKHPCATLPGTWVADLATYLQNPTRPSKDVVVSPKAPPVASIALVAMALSDREEGSPSAGTPCNLHAACYVTSPSALAPSTMQVDRVIACW